MSSDFKMSNEQKRQLVFKFNKRIYATVIVCILTLFLAVLTIPTREQFILAGFVAYWVMLVSFASMILAFAFLEIVTGEYNGF